MTTGYEIHILKTPGICIRKPIIIYKRLPRKLKKQIKKAHKFLMNQRQSEFQKRQHYPLLPSQCFQIK